MSVNQIFTEEILETSTVSVPITSSTMVHTSFIHTHTRPRSYLTPVRDEEAESQRRARSRHARQTRRSTQVDDNQRQSYLKPLYDRLLLWLSCSGCPAGGDSVRPQRSSEDEEPVSSSRPTAGGRSLSVWQVLSEERLHGADSQESTDRGYWNHWHQDSIQQCGWGENGK